MTRILLINPSKWGRGITPIWIASHLSILLKEGKHEVKYLTLLSIKIGQNVNLNLIPQTLNINLHYRQIYKMEYIKHF